MPSAAMKAPVTLVTGASSGIGAGFARAYAARGHQLVLVARREPRLTALADEIETNGHPRPSCLAADLSVPSGVDDLCAYVEQLSAPVDTLVNNAGFGSYGPFAELDSARELRMIDLNVRALVALTAWALPGMLARKRGTILQIASTAAFQAVPYMASYAASKAFVLHFTEALARECAHTGVRILAVCPGHTNTEFHAVSGVSRRPVHTPAQSVEQVVTESFRCLERQYGSTLVTGLPNKLTLQLARMLPRKSLSWLLAQAFRPPS